MASIYLNSTVFDHCLFKFPSDATLSWKSLGTVVEHLSATCDKGSFIISVDNWIEVLSRSLSVSRLFARSVFLSFAEFSDSFITESTAALPPLVVLLSLQTFYKAQNILSPRAMEADAWPSTERTPEASRFSHGFKMRHSFVTSNLNQILSLLFRVFKVCNVNPTPTLIADSIDSLFWQSGQRILPIIELSDSTSELSLSEHLSRSIASSEDTSRLFSVNDLNKRAMVLRSSDVSPDCVINVSNCCRLFLVIMTSCTSVVVSNCEQCTIFIGAAKHVLVTSSVKTTIVMTSRLLRVDNCTEVVFNSHLLRPPVVSIGCHRLVFGPFNAFYPALLVDLQTIELPVVLPKDHWKEPLGEVGCFRLEPSDIHIPFVVPFSDADVDVFKKSRHGELLCSSCPIPLPSSYASEIKARVELFKSIRNMTHGIEGEEKRQSGAGSAFCI
ncbi:hypothetical protein GEMRC1_008321 [Eukaryota sp. GEM-RC1]